MRLAELSDGVFSIAMTLLVLELHAPASAAINSHEELLADLLAIAPKLAAWGMSFLTLGIFWVAQATQIETLRRSNRDQTWLHLAFLAAVSLVPFSTAVLGEFARFHLAMVVYWINIALLGVLLWFVWAHAKRNSMFVETWTPEMMAGVERRIVMSQSLYFVAMLVSMFGAIFGLLMMLVVQLNYAVAPRFGRWLS
ncbi:MAG: TMEM175 family protein [Polymorphobacter sp.]